MPFKTVLVHVDSTASCRARVAVAAAIAEAGQGRLIGVYSSARDLREEFQDAEGSPWVQDAQAAEEIFKTAVGPLDLPFEWIRPAANSNENEIVSNGRFADLVVIGEPNPDDSYAHHVPAAHPERVVLAVGRPVLLVPYIGAPEHTGRNILVAWDASAPATRALHDAMPLLQRADRVTLLTVNPPRQEKHHGSVGERMRANLRLHGIDARVEKTYADAGLGVADVLLDWATDHGDDLMVMGVHPGRRFGERVIDGPARRIIEQMTLPVLMSN